MRRGPGTISAAAGPRTRLVLAACGVAVLVAACGGADAPVAEPSAPGTPSSTATPTDDLAPWFDELVEVAPGRSLAVTCTGAGDPAVFYLHGLIQPEDSVVWAHAPELAQRVAPETTWCEYERTNVGRSSAQPGPIPVTDSVADLRAVVEATGVATPVVLVGGSFGGLVAYTAAGTYPDDVAGVVVLDPTLPDETGLERAWLPEEYWLPPEAWRDSTEQIDVYGAYAVAQAALDGIPAVPGTVVVTEELEVPEGPNADAFRQGLRDQQTSLAARFSPGETVTVDAPHAMIPVVPDEIAQLVLSVVQAGR